MIKVSIIVPVYNAEKYIDRCIDSLINQTLSDIEIIFVNDGSTDRSEDIIKKYMQNNPNIKYYYQKNSRQGAARNNGLKHAKGEYVTLIDSDDYINKDMIKKLYNYAKKGDYDIVLCDYYLKYGNDEVIRNCYFEKFVDNNNVSLNEYILSDPAPWNKLYKREFLQENNFEFVEKLVYEDYATIPTLALYNPKIGYVEESLVYYVQSSNSTMRNDSYQKKFEDIFPASEFLYNKMENALEFHDEIEYLFIYHLLHNSAITFYSYQKYEFINKIAYFMREKYPCWAKNKYYKNENLKFKILCKLFYKNKIKLIDFVRKLKRSYEKEN